MHAPPDRPFAADEILNSLTDHAVDFVVIGGCGPGARMHTRDYQALRDVIRMKRAAGREQDFADIEALTRSPEST